MGFVPVDRSPDEVCAIVIDDNKLNLTRGATSADASGEQRAELFAETQLILEVGAKPHRVRSLGLLFKWRLRRGVADQELLGLESGQFQGIEWSASGVDSGSGGRWFSGVSQSAPHTKQSGIRSIATWLTVTSRRS